MDFDICEGSWNQFSMDTKGQLTFEGVKSYVYIKKLYMDFRLCKGQCP